jgi:hypothetical protein
MNDCDPGAGFPCLKNGEAGHTVEESFGLLDTVGFLRIP